MSWFKNLQKWQKGGLIGCGVGMLLAIIIILSPHTLGEWVANIHDALFFLAFLLYGILRSIESVPTYVEYIGLVFVIVLYGGFGAIVGRVQQITKPVWKWLLTGLLVLLLLFFYASYFI